MRANEIIRSVLDLIDNIDSGEAQPTVSISIGKMPVDVSSQDEFENDDIRRFKQIVDLTDTSSSVYANEPNELYADIDSVTTDAGGGVNNPKHPSDQRVQHPSLYPAHQHNVGE